MNEKMNFLKKLKGLIIYDFFKNIRSMRVFIAFTIVFVIGIVLTLIYGFVLKVNKSYVFMLSMLYLGDSDIVPLFLGSLLTMDAISAEFEKGTFITTISRPITRRFYYFGKLFSEFLYIIFEILIFAIVTFVISFIYFGNQTKIDDAMIILLGSIITIFFFAVFTFSLSAILKNSIASFFVTFGIWLALDIGLGLYTMMNGYSLWIFLTPLVGEAMIPIALSKAYENPSGIFTYESFRVYNSQMTNMNFSILLIGVNIIYIIILLFAGYIIFMKSDIKEE